MPKYDLVLFDMDGTIADTDELVVQTMFALFDLYRNGDRLPRERCYYFSGPPLYESLPGVFPKEYDVNFLVKEFARISEPLYDQIVTSYPHCKDVIKALREMGIKAGVITNKIHYLAKHCLEVIDLDDVIDLLIGYDDVIEHKPLPEGIYNAMKYFDVHDKSKVLYIGDNCMDIEFAKNAGVDSVLVTWGPRKVPDDINPTYKINEYFDLLEVIK